ncbi:MAG: hypothetical protein PHC75_01325 [Burkholderiales bacterium]|nr:hypothetical protein [Burkholderiales bacterium]
MKKILLYCLLDIVLLGCNNGLNNTASQVNSISKSLIIESGVFHNMGPFSDFNSITYGNGLFVAVGNNGSIAISKDNGLNWKYVDSFASVNLNSITYDSLNSIFYAVGDVGTLLSSHDGINWSINAPLNPVINLFTVSSINGNLIIGGERGLIFEIQYPRGSIVLRGGLTQANILSSGYDPLRGMMYVGTSLGAIEYKSYKYWNEAQWSNPKQLSGYKSITSLSYDEADALMLASDIGGNIYLGQDGDWTSPINVGYGGLTKILYDSLSDKFLAFGESDSFAYSGNFNYWESKKLSHKNYKDMACHNAYCVLVGIDGHIVHSFERDNIMVPIFHEPVAINYHYEAVLTEPDDATKQQYGRDSMLDIKVGSYGLKGFHLTNVSNDHKPLYINAALDTNISDVVIDYGRSSCFMGNAKLHKQLNYGESCSLVYRYNPVKMLNMSSFLAGVNLYREDKEAIQSSLVKVFYSSNNN